MNFKKIKKKEEISEQKEKKTSWRKKYIALCLVLLFFVFTVTQFKLYQDEILPVKGDTMGEISREFQMYDGIVLEQDMTVEEENNNYVDIDVKNPALRGNSGRIVFRIFDSQRNQIQKTNQPAARLKASQKYRLQIQSELEPGKTYSLRIETRGVTADKAMMLTLTSEKSEYFSELRISDSPDASGERLRIKLMHPTWNMKKIIVMIGIFAAIIFIIFIPVNLPDRVNRFLQRLLFVLTPLACFVIVQRTCKYKIFNMEQPALNLNLWIYAVVLILVYLIVNNTRLASTITVCFSYVMALINYFVSYFRGTVFVPADITAAGTAANVINSYSFQITTSVLWGGIGLMCFLTALYKLKAHKGMKILPRVVTLGAYLMMMIAFVNIFYQSNSLEEWKIHYKVWNPSISYNKNGFAVCFVVGSRYLLPEKPEGYTAAAASKKAEPYMEEAKRQKDKTEKKPNIIAIMNEAFSDLSYDGDLNVSEDYMPFIRNLKENTVKGNLHVTSFGGRTANTEYEFLTGMSMAFFSGGTVPYEHQMKHETASLTTILKEQDYTGMIALHPYKSNGYNREKAYPMLGFEQYYSRDNFEDPKLVRSYISDEADFEKITELYEKSKQQTDQPFYLFNVTMQNHGGYGEDFANLPLDITIEDKNKNEGAERYLNLIKKTDEAFEGLLDYYKSIDDPTVIVMFGDHQPNLSDSFFSSLIGEDKINKLEGIAKEHVVPFVIWANYDIPEEEIEQISVNYLSTKVSEVAGLKKTPFQCFLTEMQKEIPVITGNYYIGKDGQIRELTDKKGYEEWLDTYHYFQYNQVYDYKNLISDFFSLLNS